MEEKDYQKLLDEIREVKTLIERIESDIRKDMELKHQEYDFKFDSYGSDISFAKKTMFGVAGIILVAVLTAWLNRLGL